MSATWAPETVERMLTLCRAGKSSGEIAAEIGRTPAAVSTRLIRMRRTLGPEVVPYRAPDEWTAREIRAVERLAKQGRTRVEIAEAVGRPAWGVKRIMGMYGIASQRCRPWTAEERRMLRAMRERDMGFPECARRLGRSVESVKWQHSHLRGKDV